MPYDLLSIDPHRRQVLIAANPRSGRTQRSDLLQRLVQELQQRNLQPTLFWDLDAFSQAVARSEQSGDLRCVVAAGGDGTASTIATRTNETTPLAVFPLGTENLLAKQFGLRADPAHCASIIDAGQMLRMDVGKANDRLFLLMLSVGFDSQVVEQVHRGRRGHIARWTYAWPILRSICSYTFPSLKIQEPQSTHQAAWLFVFNLPQYANQLSIAPWAEASDGLLDVCTFSSGGVWNGLVYWYHLRQGRHIHLRDFRRSAVAELRVESDQPLPFQIDGDAGGYLPLTITTLPQRLRLIVDPSTPFSS